MGFSIDIRNKVLVKSARHCCVCHKYKGIKLEIHHIKPKNEGGLDSFENAIPLCFDCHSDAGHYNSKHPKGIKFSPKELIQHRDNWYRMVEEKKIDENDNDTIEINDNIQLFEEYSLICNLLLVHRDVISFQPVLQKQSDNNIDFCLGDLLKNINNTKFDIEQYKQMVNTALSIKERDFSESNYKNEALENAEKFIFDYLDKLELVIAQIPKSLEKAKDRLRAEIYLENNVFFEKLYDAIVFFQDEINQDIIEIIFDSWLKKRDLHNCGVGKRFWVSRDDHDLIDDISRYKIFETFDMIEFQDVFEDVENIIKEDFIIDSHSPSLHYSLHLWLFSRSETLKNKYKTLFNIIYLNNLMKTQTPEGYFKSNNYYGDSRPYVLYTALNCISIFKFSNSLILKDKAIKSIEWLISIQKREGCWEEVEQDNNNDLEYRITNTILVLEAVIRSGKQADRCIQKGLGWLLNQQNSTGLWKGWHYSEFFWTTIILELFELSKRPLSPVGGFALIGKSYLNKGLEFQTQDEIDSYRIALTTSFQGIEFLLYSFLEEKDMSIYENGNSNRTIGMKKALDELEKKLQEECLIENNKPILHKQSLSRMKHIRDEIVHKGLSIEKNECVHLINEATKFAINYSKVIFGYNIFS